MGLFDSQYNFVMDLIRKWQREGVLCGAIEDKKPWPQGPGLVLKGDTALELGRPDLGSCSILLWSENDNALKQSRVFVAGDDLIDPTVTQAPLAMIFAVRGVFKGDEYEKYCALSDAVYGPDLDGFMIRSMPSSGDLWCRISSDAIKAGRTYGQLGGAFVEGICDLDFVDSADVVIIPDAPNLMAEVMPFAKKTNLVASALMKMSEELMTECDTCDFADLCDNVDDLKSIRARLAREENAAWQEK